MKIGDRVKHTKYGAGTITNILFEDTSRELFGVIFDVSNSELHSCLGATEPYRGLFCNGKELEII